jgi:hypothetical protein
MSLECRRGEPLPRSLVLPIPTCMRRSASIHSGLPCGSAHDVFTAIAAMSSGDVNGHESEVERRRSERPIPIPTIVFHGDLDTTVHPRNGDRFAEELITSDCAKRVEVGRVPGGRNTALGSNPVFEQNVIRSDRCDVRSTHHPKPNTAPNLRAFSQPATRLRRAYRERGSNQVCTLSQAPCLASAPVSMPTCPPSSAQNSLS